MNIMLIDDDQESLDSLDSALRLHGFQVRCFDSPVQALHAYQPQTIDVVIADYHLPGMTGTEFLEEIHRKTPHAPVIIISGEARATVENLSLEAGACAFYPKPLNIKSLVAQLKQLADLKANR